MNTLLVLCCHCHSASNDGFLTGLLSGLIPSLITAIILVWGYKKQNDAFKEQISVQKEETFKTNSLKLIIDIQNEFNDLKKDRKKISEMIFRNKILEKPSIDIEEYKSILEIENVLDLLDSLGFYIKNGYIKADIVWQNFYHWFNGYYWLYRKYEIKKFRFDKPQVWNNLDYLKSVLDPIELQQSGLQKLEELTIKEIKQFFEDETYYVE